jgi:hypothetical protein
MSHFEISPDYSSIIINNKKENIPDPIKKLMNGHDCDLYNINGIEFLKKINIKRIGFHGIAISDYYEFIYRIEGDLIIEHFESKLSAKLEIDNIMVTFGDVSSFGLLVLGCVNPLQLDFYKENDLYQYISIRFNSKLEKINSILPYCICLINKVLSKKKSYLIEDDFLNKNTDDDTLSFQDDVDVKDIHRDLFHLNGKKYTTNPKTINVYQKIALAYKAPYDSRFFIYFQILENYSKKQKIAQGESQFAIFYKRQNTSLKNKVSSKAAVINFDDMIECIRSIRNSIVHNNGLSWDNKTYPMIKILKFQEELIKAMSYFDI